MHRLRRHLGRRRAPWATRARLFGPGEIRLALLSLLGAGPAHGYELMTRLEERCGGAYQASAGTVYPTLQQLEDEGLARASPVDGTRKVYELTRRGSEELQRCADEIEEIWRRASAWGEWGMLGHPDAAEIVGPALRLAKAALAAVVGSRSDPAAIDAVRTALDEARERIERIRRKGRR